MASSALLAVVSDGVCVTSIGGVLSDATVARATRWERDRDAGVAMVKFRPASGSLGGWMARADGCVIVLEADAPLVTDRTAAAVLRECTAVLSAAGAPDGAAATPVASSRGVRARLEGVLAKHCGDAVAGHVTVHTGMDGGDGVGAAASLATGDPAASGAGAALRGVGNRGVVVDHKQAKWDAVESELNNIKAAAVDSIGLLVDRGEKLDSLVTRSDTLVSRATTFRKATVTLERVERWDMVRGYACLCATAAVAIIVLVIALW